MRRHTVAAFAGILSAACASAPGDGGDRPPQGAGPAGTDFGYWNRDAEGAVDASFRQFVTRTYNAGDRDRAMAALTTDGFSCKPGERPEAQAAPQTECLRLFKLNDDVHAWTVEFWAGEGEPRARYTRTHIRNPLMNYDEKKR
jgi:hypothetical protein